MKYLLSTIFCSIILVGSLEAQHSERSNVLFIAIDDLSDWTGFLGGHPQTLTPNMDKLAEQGMVFTNAHCAASVCNPSRTAIMSGYRPTTTGVLGNAGKLRESPVLKDAVMLNQWFQQHGYCTMSRGKIYHTPRVEKDAWDYWENVSGNYGKPPKKEGFEFSGIPTSEYDGNFNWGPTNSTKEETPDYKNALWAAEQLNTKHDKPFFMAVGIFRPHLGWFVPEEYFDKFPLKSIQLPLIKDDDLDDTPGQYATKEYKLTVKYELRKNAVQAYLASINYADECVGVILEALAESEYAENTIVVLWGDHGWHLGEKQRYKKFTLWDRATKSPLIIYAPGITESNSKTNRTVNLLDLYPTLTHLCGLPPNTENEGNSLVPLLKNPLLEWDNPTITSLVQGSTIKTEKWRYILRNDGTEELYDQVNDPHEWKNLINDPDYQHIRKSLKKQLLAIVK